MHSREMIDDPTLLPVTRVRKSFAAFGLPIIHYGDRSICDIPALWKPVLISLAARLSGSKKADALIEGEGGITHGALAVKPHFECGAFDHSATSPGNLVGTGRCGALHSDESFRRNHINCCRRSGRSVPKSQSPFLMCKRLRIQFVSSDAPVRQAAIEKPDKIFGMPSLEEMSELVNDHIFQALRGLLC